MKIGSAFAGIGGFDLAFERCGAQVAWQIEIDRACNMVLERHWPHVKRYGDIRQVKAHDPNGGADEVVEPVDVICAGFPCQDLSVAGRRKGLSGEHSGLFFEVIRLVKEMRERTNGWSPTFVVLENVPGLLSSNRGRDFAVVLWELAQSGALDIAWAVLDAQWFGVPQRRRRVFIVADFGGERAAEILSVPYGRKGDTPPRRETGSTVATLLASGAGAGRPAGVASEPDFLVTQALTGTYANGGPDDNKAQAGFLVAHTLRAEGADASEDGTGRGVSLVAASLTASYAKQVDNSDRNGGPPNVLCTGMTVRRLTPRECERLQGLPDDWTRWGPDGQVISDSARYRMIGNAVAVPVVEWIARRLLAVAN